MNDILRALAIAAVILFPVIILTVIVSMAAVKRGAAAMHGPAHDVPGESLHVGEAAAAPVPGKSAKAAAPAREEISVIQILIFGTGLFTLTILLLLGVSLLQHMG